MELLQDKCEFLVSKGYYIIGDSAYSLRSFLITPFDDAMHGTAEDNFNYFHSSSRICIECTFGEIDQRWGILWRPLRFSMKHNTQIIDACIRLHNFIVDFREKKQEPTPLQQMDREVYEDETERFLAVNRDLINYGIDFSNALIIDLASSIFFWYFCLILFTLSDLSAYFFLFFLLISL